MRCVIWGEDIRVARGRDSVLLYVQWDDEDGDANMSAYGGEWTWRNKEAPVWAAKFDMWMCTIDFHIPSVRMTIITRAGCGE